MYTLLEGARDRVARLMTSETPDDLDPAVVLSTAEAFLKACDYARGVLPKLQTGAASQEAFDENLIQQIEAAASQKPPEQA